MTENKSSKTFEEYVGRNLDKVSFGNSKNPNKLESVFEFSVFGGEETLSLKFPKDYAGKPKNENGVLTVEDDDDGLYSTKHSDDVFKFGLILKKKPAKNSWTSTITGHENLDFFFQPALANENGDGSTWENSEWGGKRTRPADVNNSYAVYHKTKRDHILGQKNYATGKVAHIYRPKFIDANGAWVWGDINISNGEYTVTCPQSFLDSAVYPVKANDTFGYTTIGGSDDTGNVDLYYSWKSTSNPAGNGTLTSMTMAYWLASGTGHSKYALYTVSGTTHTLVASSGTSEFTIVRTTKPTSDLGTWTSANTGAASISNTQYYLATNNDNGNIQNAYDSGASDELRAELTAYSGFPNATLNVTFGASLRLSFYATYTPAASGSNRRSRMTTLGCGI